MVEFLQIGIISNLQMVLDISKKQRKDVMLCVNHFQS